MTHWQARLLYRERFPGEPEVEARARELPSAWYFPRSFIGSCGLVIDKADGHIHVFGSAFPLETWLWAYERGFRHDTYDLVIAEVHELDAAVTLLEGLGLSLPGFAYLPRRTYSRAQLSEHLARLPARFVNQKLWRYYRKLRTLEASGLPFRYVVEPDSHCSAPPGTPALLLLPSVLMPLAEDEASRHALRRRRDRGELDVIVRAGDFEAAEGNLSRLFQEARMAARQQGLDRERHLSTARALQASLAALQGIPCRRAGEAVRPGDEVIWGAAPIPSEARPIAALAELEPWL